MRAHCITVVVSGPGTEKLGDVPDALSFGPGQCGGGR